MILLRIKIGEISKMLGLVPTTLRYYEKVGIVNPEVDRKNKYRYYHAQDLVWLILCRGLFKTGLSLSETYEYVYHMSSDSALARLKEQKRVASGKAARYTRMERYLAAQSALLEDAQALAGRCAICLRPPLLRLDFGGETLFEQPERMEAVTAWLDFQPFVYLQQHITESELHRGARGLDHIWGLAVEERTAKELGIPENACVQRLAQQLCVRTAFYMNIRGALQPHHYAHALDFIKKHHFTICGSAETQVVSYAGEMDQREALIVMDIPISD